MRRCMCTRALRVAGSCNECWQWIGEVPIRRQSSDLDQIPTGRTYSGFALAERERGRALVARPGVLLFAGAGAPGFRGSAVEEAGGLGRGIVGSQEGNSFAQGAALFRPDG